MGKKRQCEEREVCGSQEPYEEAIQAGAVLCGGCGRRRPGTTYRLAKKVDMALTFAGKIAKVMKDLSSSHVYFIVQQAYGEIDWNEVEEILKKVQESASI